MTAYESADYKKAIEKFEKCVEVNKNNDEALYYLAYSYQKNGDSKKAEETFKKLVDEFPDSDFYTKAKNQLPDSGNNGDNE